jgi:hypothetical protein
MANLATVREATTALLAAAQSVSDSMIAFEKARLALEKEAGDACHSKTDAMPIYFSCAISATVSEFADAQLTYRGDYVDGPELVSRIVEVAELVDRLTGAETQPAVAA